MSSWLSTLSWCWSCLWLSWLPSSWSGRECPHPRERTRGRGRRRSGRRSRHGARCADALAPSGTSFGQAYPSTTKRNPVRVCRTSNAYPATPFPRPRSDCPTSGSKRSRVRRPVQSGRRGSIPCERSQGPTNFPTAVEPDRSENGCELWGIPANSPQKSPKARVQRCRIVRGSRSRERSDRTRGEEASDREEGPYFRILVTRPAPTVRPPSRIANRKPSSIAIGAINSTVISVLSPGIHISVPAGRTMLPVTSVVRK